MKAIVWLVLVLCAEAHAILPLPYPTEPASDELSAALEAEKDPRQIQAYSELQAASSTREMELPVFSDDKDTLGYDSQMFQVPAELVKRVEFWKRIYTEITTKQALLHDSDYPGVIYGVVDLTAAMSESLPPRRRAKLVKQKLDAEKKKIEHMLRFFDENKATPDKIPVEQFPIFTQFQDIPGDDKFTAAIDRVRAQIGQRDRIVQGFLYGGRYFEALTHVFQTEHLPQELTRLPLVESAFNLAARSKVGASGVWQFMLSTGKRYLRIDRAVDERNDPIAAAWAAAELLKANYQALGSWPLAVTAYNHGREGMARAVREVASNDLVEIIRRYKAPSFGFASSNFYSEFLAILEIEREYRQHFGKLLVDSPIQYEEFRVSDDIRLGEIAEACRSSSEELARLNPALTDWVVSGRGFVPHGYTMKVPAGKIDTCKVGYRSVTKVTPKELKRTSLSLVSLRPHHRARGRRVAAVARTKRSRKVKRVKLTMRAKASRKTQSL